MMNNGHPDETKDQVAPQGITTDFNFNFKFNITQVNLIIAALEEAPHKFSKVPIEMIFGQALPQQEAEIKKNQKPILHTV